MTEKTKKMILISIGCLLCAAVAIGIAARFGGNAEIPSGVVSDEPAQSGDPDVSINSDGQTDVDIQVEVPDASETDPAQGADSSGLEQTIQADEPQTYAEGDVTFTIPETALAATLTGDFAEAQTALAEGNITINVTVNDTTGEEPEPTIEPLTLTAENLELGGSYNAEAVTKNISVNQNSVDIEYTNLMKGTGQNANKIQSNDNKNPSSNIRNLTALPEIESIVITASNGIAADSLQVAFSTDAIAEIEGEGYSPVASDGSTSVTIEATVGATFFRLVRGSDGGGQYYDSIVVNFAA